MAHYTPELLAMALGKGFNPNADYILETHRGAQLRMAGNPTLKFVGTVNDFTATETGTMIVLEKIKPQPAKKLSLLKRIVG